MKALSKRNLQYMMKFATEWPMEGIAQQGAAQIGGIAPPVVAQIQSVDNQGDTIVPPVAAQFQAFETHAMARVPWSHHRLLLDKIETKEERDFYCHQIVQNNWSKRVLINKLEQGLYQSQGQLSNNFKEVLPAAQAFMVTETFKDPYFFGFLQLGDEASEREIEDRLTSQIEELVLDSQWSWKSSLYNILIQGPLIRPCRFMSLI